MLGRKVRESTIRRIAHTTTDGTDEFGLFRAIKHYGYEWQEFTDRRPTTGWNRIKRNLKQGSPSLLCVSQVEPCDHWVSAVGLQGSNVLVFDPWKPESKINQYSGLQVVDIDDFYSKWSYFDNNVTKYYSIVIKAA